MARFVLSGPDVPQTPRPPPTVLVLALPGPAGDEIFAELSSRKDLTLLHVATASSASVALRELPVSLLVIGPEVPPAEIDRILADRDSVRPKTPVLALRARPAEAPSAWKARGVVVLRLPLLPDVLTRSVDLVLDIRGAR